MMSATIEEKRMVVAQQKGLDFDDVTEDAVKEFEAEIGEEIEIGDTDPIVEDDEKVVAFDDLLEDDKGVDDKGVDDKKDLQVFDFDVYEAAEDENHEHHGLARYVLDKVAKDDHVGNEKSPLHQPIADTQKKYHEVNSKLVELEKQNELLQTGFRRVEVDGKSVLVNADNDPSKGIFGGISEEDIEDSDTPERLRTDRFLAMQKYGQDKVAYEKQESTFDARRKADKAQMEKYQKNFDEYAERNKLSDDEKVQFKKDITELSFNITNDEMAETLAIRKSGGIEKYKQAIIAKAMTDLETKKEADKVATIDNAPISKDKANTDIQRNVAKKGKLEMPDLNSMTEAEIDDHMAKMKKLQDKNILEII
jgi:hypothetical protein